MKIRTSLKLLSLPLVAALMAVILGQSAFGESSESEVIQLPQLSSSTSELLGNAEEKEIRDCMARRGFDYLPFVGEVKPTKLPEPGNVEAAKERGYGLSALKEASSRLESPNDKVLAQMDTAARQAWSDALIGPAPTPGEEEAMGRQLIELTNGAKVTFDPNSCISVAQSELYGDSGMWRALNHEIDLLRSTVVQRIQSDSAVKEALEVWRDCMDKRGYRYDAPGAAARDLADNAGTPHDGAIEIQVATADAECYRDAELESTQANLQPGYEEEVAGVNAGLVSEFEAVVDEATERAKSME